MKYFHGTHKKKSYFEGWYFKHQNGSNTIAFIPAYHVDGSGKQSASIQVITETTAYDIPYPAHQFFAKTDKLWIKIGENVFSEKGIHIAIHTPQVSISGDIAYQEFSPIAGDIMGPFQFVPGMQCVHGIVSMKHQLRGALDINGELVSFEGGTGYIETDRGNSFPKEYLWTQCNLFEEADCAVIASVANIPFGPAHFMGCICDIQHKGKEFRLATYYGAKAPSFSGKELLLTQGNYKLRVALLQGNPQKLKSPQRGSMSGTVHESAACHVRYLFTYQDDIIFDNTSPYASFEYVKAER